MRRGIVDQLVRLLRPSKRSQVRSNRDKLGDRSIKSTSRTGLVIEYSPSLDGDPDPGEVVWTWVPWEEDPTQGKDRPVVIVGRRGALLVGVDGRVVAHVHASSRVRLRWVSGTTAWGEERDEDNVPTLVRYRVTSAK